MDKLYLVEFNDGSFMFFVRQEALEGLNFIQVKQIFSISRKTKIEDILEHVLDHTPEDWIKLDFKSKMRK